MPHGVLYVPVSLTSVGDKRPLQYAVDDNIRECRHYLVLLTEDWGPPERNFPTTTTWLYNARTIRLCL